MVHVYRSDPWRKICRMKLQDPCSKQAIATYMYSEYKRYRVCDDCAVSLHLKGFSVYRDDGRDVVSS